jgi:hypothetical protein
MVEEPDHDDDPRAGLALSELSYQRDLPAALRPANAAKLDVRAVVTSDSSYHHRADGREQLYDLAVDPGEQHDLAADPDAQPRLDTAREQLNLLGN